MRRGGVPGGLLVSLRLASFGGPRPRHTRRGPIIICCRRYWVATGFRESAVASTRKYLISAGLCEPHGGWSEAVSSCTGLETPGRSQGPPSAADFHPLRDR